MGCLLVLLSGMIGILALFTGWYLVNRKPVTELLPPIGMETGPALPVQHLRHDQADGRRGGPVG